MRANRFQSSSLLWGLFCANSWTWCIGMFLPVLLINRWGWWGFLAFAIPNVVGCAAFGYVVRTPFRSEAIVAGHGSAAVWFSIVTVAYHMFFVGFLFTEVIAFPAEMTLGPFAAGGILLGLGCVLSFLPNRDWLALTVIVYAASLSAFAIIGLEGLQRVGWKGDVQLDALAWLAPTLVFGFVLCPYLDLTFHRALQHASSRHAFAVFGIAFAAMLLLTCAIWFAPEAAGVVLPPIAIVHILFQSVFTIGAHLREVRVSPAIIDPTWRVLAMLGPIAAAALPYLAFLLNHSELNEENYVRFLVFYGLIFPAYVLLFIGPRPVMRQTKGHIIAFAVLITVCLPLFEFGYLWDRPWLLCIALALLAATALLRSRVSKEVES